MFKFPPDHDSAFIDGKVRGQPFSLDTGGFPEDHETFLDVLRRLQKDRGLFLGKIKSFVGGTTYSLIAHRQHLSYADKPIFATWLRSRTYDPPLAADTVCVVTQGRDKRYVFYAKGSDAVLGEIKMYCGAPADIPTGWLACTKANADAGAVNGITPPNLEGRFVVAECGDAANTTATDVNDTEYAYTTGDTGGYNRHGKVGANEVNNHTGHTLTHDHTISGQSTDMVTVDENLDGITESVVDSVHFAGGANSASPTAAHTTDTDNRPLYYALAFIVFVGV